MIDDDDDWSVFIAFSIRSTRSTRPSYKDDEGDDECEGSLATFTSTSCCF